MGCEVKKIPEIEYTEVICSIENDAITDPSKVYYDFSGGLQEEKYTAPSYTGDFILSKDRNPVLIHSLPSGTPGELTDFPGPAGPVFEGFKETEKAPKFDHSVQKLKDVSWKLTFENATLNYAAILLRFGGTVSWETIFGGLEPSPYEGFILPNGDMCMNILNPEFPLNLSSTKGKFIFTSGTSLWYNIIGWEISERCDLGCKKCQPREKIGGEWMFFDLLMAHTPILLEHTENGNIKV
jgi:hypothetical protein